MDSLKIIIFLLTLIGIFFAIYKTISYVHRNLRIHFQAWRFVWLFRVVLILSSCAVGYLFLSFAYNWSETQRVNGIPIPWAAWEYSNGSWKDFISPLSPLLILFDFIIGIGIAHFLVAIPFFVKTRKSN